MQKRASLLCSKTPASFIISELRRNIIHILQDRNTKCLNNAKYFLQNGNKVLKNDIKIKKLKIPSLTQKSAKHTKAT